MSSVKKLAAKLVELRAEQSIYQVAKSTGIHRELITRYETGESIPGNENLKILAHFYQMDYEVLKLLAFEDIYPEHSQERQLLLRWLRQLETGLS